MKISNLIFIGIFFILLLFSITTYTNFNQSEKVRENASFFDKSSTFVRQINQLQRNVLNLERGLRGYLITGEEYLLQAYHSLQADNKVLFTELEGFAEVNPKQRTQLDQIKAYYQEWIDRYADPLADARRKSDSAFVSSSTFEKMYMTDKVTEDEEKIYSNLHTSFSQIREDEYIDREKKRIVLSESERQTKMISIVLTGLSIITGFIIAFFLTRHISRRITKMVKLADNIAVGNYHVKVTDTGNDELSKLSQSLNNMAEILEENITLLKRKNQELDQFAHIVSHDLKAPLRGIDNVITWIEEDYGKDIPVKVNEYLDLIKGRVKRSENLIQGILTYARIGKEIQTKEEIQTSDMVLEILDNLYIREGLAVEVSDDMPVLYSDKVPLTQVFTNLISNALKYHDKETGFVKVYSIQHKTHYEFFVEDNGPGISDQYHDKIFVIFQTLQERDSFESTGVGLAIVKKILVDRKETIKISSTPGNGSVFFFYLV